MSAASLLGGSEKGKKRDDSEKGSKEATNQGTEAFSFPLSQQYVLSQIYLFIY